MLQLDLFGGPPVDVAAAGPLAPDAAPEVAPDAVEGLDPGQLDLFDARAAQLRAARAAVEREDFEGARRILAKLLARGDDPEARRAMAGIAAVQARAEAARRMSAPARALELLACAGEIADAAGLQGALCAVLQRWAARIVQIESGDDACLEGWPIGVYFARGGDLVAARASLAAALSLSRRARTLYALGNLAAREGDPAAARDWYCEALARDPFDADAVSAILDPEIAELPDIARYEMELDPHPEAWTAPLGMITGVFRIPVRAPSYAPPSCAPIGSGSGGGAASSPEKLDVLASAQAFIAALVAAESAVSTEPPIAARRAMKHLQPRLFAAYLERRSRGHAVSAGYRP